MIRLVFFGLMEIGFLGMAYLDFRSGAAKTAVVALTFATANAVIFLWKGQ